MVLGVWFVYFLFYFEVLSSCVVFHFHFLYLCFYWPFIDYPISFTRVFPDLSVVFFTLLNSLICPCLLLWFLLPFLFAFCRRQKTGIVVKHDCILLGNTLSNCCCYPQPVCKCSVFTSLLKRHQLFFSTWVVELLAVGYFSLLNMLSSVSLFSSSCKTQLLFERHYK